mgnify:CR=1 FL=1
MELTEKKIKQIILEELTKTVDEGYEKAQVRYIDQDSPTTYLKRILKPVVTRFMKEYGRIPSEEEINSALRELS